MGYIEGMADAPSALNDSIAQAKAALAGAMAANEQRQTIAREFIVTHGSDVGAAWAHHGRHVHA